MTIEIMVGDCRERLKELDAESVDSAVCDPPYHLTSIVKRFGSANAAPAKAGKTGAYARASRGFMGQTWDGGDVAFDPATWEAVFRVLKPGAHLVAFGGTRTFHRLVTAIEDAGFEIRDSLFYIYGSGFPKSHNVKKGAREAVCRCPASDYSLRCVPEAENDASGLVSTCEATDLLSTVQRSSSRSGLGSARAQGLEGAVAGELCAGGHEGTEEPILEGRRLPQAGSRQLSGGPLCEGAGLGEANGARGRLHHGTSAGDGPHVRLPADAVGGGQSQGPQPGEQRSEEPGTLADERGSQAWGGWSLCPRCGKPDIPEGLGTALKPAVEPICLARKPLCGTVAANVLQHGTGAINVDGCRVETTDGYAENAVTQGINTARTSYEHRRERRTFEPSQVGRWPANIIHDGSDEVLAGFPDEAGAAAPVHRRGADKFRSTYGTFAGNIDEQGRTFHGDSGSAARFFYSAKAAASERGEGNNHPTVKPVDLMRWLCRLVTPKGGLVLDPFAGSGSTLIAADAEQFNAIGCELSPEYAAIAERRVRAAAGLFADVRAA